MTIQFSGHRLQTTVIQCNETVIIAAIAAVAMMLTISVAMSDAYAQQHYIGAYAVNDTVYRVDNALMGTTFTKGAQDPEADILTVLSIAGSTGADFDDPTDHTGRYYQAVTQWEVTNDKLYATSQVWQRFSLDQIWPETIETTSTNELCDLTDHGLIVNAAYWDPNRDNVEFYHYCWGQGTELINVLVQSYDKSEYFDPSSYFLYGQCIETECAPNFSHTAKFAQWGIESPDLATHFNITQLGVSFRDSIDFQDPQILRAANEEVRLIYDESAISWTEISAQDTTPTEVGGLNFDNVYAHAAETDDPSLPPGFIVWEGGHLNCENPDPGQCLPEDTILWNADSGLITTVASTAYNISPRKATSYEGERRVVYSSVDPTIVHAFYYDGNIKSKISTDGGETWGAATSLGTGALVTNNERWSIATTTVSGTQYIYVFYWVQGNPDTQNVHFKVSRGIVSSDGSSVSWSGPIEVGYTLGDSDCSGSFGVCAAVVTTTDQDGTMWAAFRYRPGGQSFYYYSIKYSTNGGWDWFDSIPHSSIGSTSFPVFALTPLASGKMLFSYAFTNSAILYYKIFTPGSGWTATPYEEELTGWDSSSFKDMSSDSNSTGHAHIAFVGGGGESGTLRVAIFDNDTGLYDHTEVADSSLNNHQLPSIRISKDDNIQVFTLAGSSPLKVYETTKSGNMWAGPTTPFGTSFNNVNNLSAGLGAKASALWQEDCGAVKCVKYSFGYS